MNKRQWIQEVIREARRIWGDRYFKWKLLTNVYQAGCKAPDGSRSANVVSASSWEDLAHKLKQMSSQE